MKRSRVNPISAKRRERIAKRRLTMAIVEERDGWRCQAQRVWRHDCSGPLVGHEPRKRSAGGDETDPDCVLLVCNYVNQLVEQEPNWARSLGLSVHSWEGWRWSENWGAA